MRSRNILPAVLLVGILCLSGCYTRSQRLYQRAEAFMASGKDTLAAREYRKLVLEEPSSPLADDALYKLAYLFREEFELPRAAIRTYQLLTDRYEHSPYADDAFVWIAYIQRRDLQDSEAVRATCEMAENRFSDRPRTKARCYLYLVQALYETGKYEAAMAEAAALEQNYPEQTRQCSTAALIRAKAAEKVLDDPEQVERLYMRVLNEYPDSYCAIQARSVLGLRYYDKQVEQQEAEKKRLRAAARMIHGIPGFANYEDYRERLLAPMVSLLAHRNLKMDRESLLALSGAAFGFAYNPQKPSATSRTFLRQPHVLIGETLGFATSVWTGDEAEASFNALTNAIRLDHPVLVHHSSPQPRWVIVTGWRPAVEQVLYMPAGAEEMVGTNKERFVSRWTSEKSFEHGPHYMFFLGQRRGKPPADELLRETIRTAIANMEPRRLNGTHSGMAAYDALAEHLENQPGEDTDIVVTWAKTQIPALQHCRRAARVFLSAHADSIPEATAHLTAAAELLSGAESELEVLKNAIIRAASAKEEIPGDVKAAWGRTAKQTRFIQKLDRQALTELQGAFEQ